MSDMKKFIQIIAESMVSEASSYEMRVQGVVDKILHAHNLRPYTSKENVMDDIHLFSSQVSDYKIGGRTQKDFIRDVIAGLKGKLRIKSATQKPKIEYHKVANAINDAIGNSFPDGDPFDTLHSWLIKNGYVGRNDDAMPILDKGARLNGYQSYFKQLESTWDDYAKDNPGNSMGVTTDSNPWR